MYQQSSNPHPNHGQYGPDFNYVGSEDVSSLPVYNNLQHQDYAYLQGRVYSTHDNAAPISSTVGRSVQQSHYTGAIQQYIPLLEHSYNMAELHSDNHIDTFCNHLNFECLEGSTAASEYSYSDGYESGVANEMANEILSRQSSYSPTSEIYTIPDGSQAASYLPVHSGSGNLSQGVYHSRRSSPSTTSRARTDSLSTSPSPSHQVTKQLSDSNEASIKKPRSRKPFEPERRLEVRRMRQTGACFRCRWLKKPCGVGTPCPQCMNVRGRVWTYPCMRVNMTDLSGLSDIGFQHLQRGFLNSNILCWAGTEVTIQVTHGFNSPSNPCGAMRIVVEEVVPRDAQVLTCKWPTLNKTPAGTIWRWYDETRPSLEDCYQGTTMPYAIRRFQVLEEDLDKYLDCDRGHTAFGAPGAYADSMDGLGFTKAMIRAAWDYSELTGSSIIKKASRVKTAVYLQNYLLQCDTGPAGVRAIAPAFVQIQLDLLIDGRRAELEKEVLAELQRIVFSRKRKHWLTIFFTIYILLNALERTLWNHYAWKEKGYECPDFSYERACEIYDVLIAVFRGINQGGQPLTKVSDIEEIMNILGSEYGEAAVGIFRSVTSLINSQAPSILQRRDTIFTFHDPFSLEGRFTSALLM
ncbi:hypothetical protein BDZ91DRAFT_419157 [Kalaharituber pfeilii]|nr:hypothetical protein BDZ91DRAFT_419157 [Kalaharituber pfeilii]